MGLIKTWIDNSDAIHRSLGHGMIFCALATVIYESRGNAAPYGRYSARTVWGPLWNAKLCWILMECPNLLMAAACWRNGREAVKSNKCNQILLLMFVLHYINRALIFPLRMKNGKGMPVGIMLLAFSFCCINGFLQCWMLCGIKAFPDSWLLDPRFLVGVMVFTTGFYLNYQADGILRKLRAGGNAGGYKIPYGGLFKYVSGANFLGEIVEWAGYALAAWHPAALAFALFTAANVGPRALQHHAWYREKFRGEYPEGRRALVPFLL